MERRQKENQTTQKPKIIPHFYWLFVAFTIILCTISLNSPAQKSEAGITVGGFYYVGDLNLYYHFLFTRPATGIIYKRNLNERFTIKGNLIGGMLAGNSKTSGVHSAPYIKFNTFPHIEGSATCEFSYYPYEIGNRKMNASPYIFIGLGGFYSNPSVSPNDLESKAGKNNKIMETIWEHIAVPFGMGYKFNRRNKTSISLEWGLRKTFNDLIDGVSDIDPLVEGAMIKQKSKVETNDLYSFVGIGITFRLQDKREKCPAHGD